MSDSKESSILRKKARHIPERARAKGYKGIIGYVLYLCRYAKVKIFDILARHCPVPGLREFLYRQMRVKIGKGTFVDRDVYFDTMWPELISIGEGCGVVTCTILLIHQRDLRGYSVGDHVHDLPYIVKPIRIGNHVSIGANSIIFPGVTIGDGAFIGAGSVVRHDVAPYTLVAGNPASVVKDFKHDSRKNKSGRGKSIAEKKRTDQVGVGEEFEPYEFQVTPEFNQQYLEAVEDYNPRYLRETEDGPPIVHPALLINHSNIPRTPSFHLPTNMAAVHTHEKVEFFNPGRVGKTFRVCWKVIDLYEKRGRQYQVKEVSVTDEDGLQILRRIMTDTYMSGME